MAKYKKKAKVKTEVKKDRSFAEKIMIAFAVLIVLSMVVSLFGSFASQTTDTPVPPIIEDNATTVPDETDGAIDEAAPTPESSIPMEQFELVYLPASVLFES